MTIVCLTILQLHKLGKGTGGGWCFIILDSESNAENCNPQQELLPPVDIACMLVYYTVCTQYRTIGWFCAALSRDSGSWREDEKEETESLFQIGEESLKIDNMLWGTYHPFRLSIKEENVEFQKEHTQLIQLFFAKSRPNVPAQNATLTCARRVAVICSAHSHGWWRDGEEKRVWECSDWWVQQETKTRGITVYSQFHVHFWRLPEGHQCCLAVSCRNPSLYRRTVYFCDMV